MVKSRRGLHPKGRLTGTYGKAKTNLILHREGILVYVFICGG